MVKLGVMQSIISHKATKSWIKVFSSTVLALFLADGGDVVGVGWGDLRTYLAAGVASVLPLVITYLDPSDTRFGMVSGDKIEVTEQ